MANLFNWAETAIHNIHDSHDVIYRTYMEQLNLARDENIKRGSVRWRHILPSSRSG